MSSYAAKFESVSQEVKTRVIEGAEVETEQIILNGWGLYHR